MDRNFLDQLRQQTSLRDLIGRYVQWDRKKSEEGRGILWACCPFHQEKSASFKVDVGRGQYYCFGCHKKGDAISFLQDRDGLGFVEAVRQLADMAGLAIP
ncbi:MAG TPA: DNA primase, partial [Alphaproteobacteria bacterium]|nr:DNA primase [Alphaproteobacteria bacterium]